VEHYPKASPYKNAGIKKYVCIGAEPTEEFKQLGGGTQCGAWHGEEVDGNVAEVVECRAFCNGTSCGGRWGCTFFGLPRPEIFYEGTGPSYGKRWGLTFAHCLWLGIVYMCVCYFAALSFQASSTQCNTGKVNMGFCLLAPVVWFLFTFILYLIMFYRNMAPSDMWGPYVRYGTRAPAGPGFGLMTMSLIAWTCTAASAYRYGDEAEASAVGLVAAALGTSVMVTSVFFYKCGFIGAVPFIVLSCFVLYVLIENKMSVRSDPILPLTNRAPPTEEEEDCETNSSAPRIVVGAPLKNWAVPAS